MFHAVMISLMLQTSLATPTPRSAEPLNLNMGEVVLPTASDDRLVKLLLIGDSQMGQSPSRLAGQVQKWDADIVGRLMLCVSQTQAGVHFTSVADEQYGAFLTSTLVELGEDHGDGNTGSHFHHSRRFSVAGNIQPDGSQLGSIGLTPGGYTRPIDLDVRKNARVAMYDRPGGFTRFQLAGLRGWTEGPGESFGLPSDPGPTLDGSGIIRWYNKAIPPAGELGSLGRHPVGVVIRDDIGLDADRSLHLVGALIHNSPEGSEFPDRGLVVSQISQNGWSAYDHVNTLNEDAIDASIGMNEGFDTVMIMLGHNPDDDYLKRPDAYPYYLRRLVQRISGRHLAAGYFPPDFVFVAPWPRPLANDNSGRLAAQTTQLRELCEQDGHGFINLYDFFQGQPLAGQMTTPRGTATYTMDPGRTHPGNPSTASNLMLDIEWSFDPANWTDSCPADLAEPFGAVNFFDLLAYIDSYNTQSPQADLAEPFGALNFFDLTAYIGSFNAGCP